MAFEVAHAFTSLSDFQHFPVDMAACVYPDVSGMSFDDSDWGSADSQTWFVTCATPSGDNYSMYEIVTCATPSGDDYSMYEIEVPAQQTNVITALPEPARVTPDSQGTDLDLLATAALPSGIPAGQGQWSQGEESPSTVERSSLEKRRLSLDCGSELDRGLHATDNDDGLNRKEMDGDKRDDDSEKNQDCDLDKEIVYEEWKDQEDQAYDSEEDEEEKDDEEEDMAYDGDDEEEEEKEIEYGERMDHKGDAGSEKEEKMEYDEGKDREDQACDVGDAEEGEDGKNQEGYASDSVSDRGSDSNSNYDSDSDSNSNSDSGSSSNSDSDSASDSNSNSNSDSDSNSNSDSDSTSDSESDSNSDSSSNSDSDSSPDSDYRFLSDSSDDDSDCDTCPDSCICKTGQRRIKKIEREYATRVPLLKLVLRHQTLGQAKLQKSSCCYFQCCKQWKNISTRYFVNYR